MEEAYSTLSWYASFQKADQYIFTLKMATVLFAETLDNFKHSTPLILENQIWTLMYMNHAKALLRS
jgi:hypothetical protein